MNHNPEQAETPVSVPVDLVRLRRIGQRPGLADYILQMWDRRSFVMFDAQARVQNEHNNNRLGSAWLILTPLLTGFSYFLVFGLLLDTSKGIPNFIGYLVIGVFTFSMTTRSITGGAKSLSSNKSMIRAFQFPRAALPLAVNLRELIANVPVMLVMLVIIILAGPNEAITWRWILMVPAILLQFIFNLGISLILARMIFKIPDIGMLLSFVMRLWLYMSAVFFSASRWDSFPLLAKIMDFNPIYIVITIIRDSVLYETTPSMRSWVILGLWALVALAVGTVVFWRGEETYGRA